MTSDTKDRILVTALKMFSERGYEGTNLRELLAELGFTKAAFYKHYESKEELWNAVLDEMCIYYEEHFGSIKNMPPIPESTDELKKLTLKMLDFTMHDEKIIMTRKILLIEQFRDDRVRELATEHFSAGLESMFTTIFEGMMKNGSLKKDHPAMLAFAYTAPISSLIQLCDREPEKNRTIMRRIKAYIEHFISVYGNQHKD
ncbi:MAG: TetR/AcrR family transcriptional regulator [Lachnospiraceae bacterium]|nr:TetR/AcrR family transcriptional regulator [Lachnospiraceae bacterium]